FLGLPIVLSHSSTAANSLLSFLPISLFILNWITVILCYMIFLNSPLFSCNLSRVPLLAWSVFPPSFTLITIPFLKSSLAPVSQRIKYKIAVLTFKALHFGKPSYLVDLQERYQPPRNLPSSG